MLEIQSSSAASSIDCPLINKLKVLNDIESAHKCTSTVYSTVHCTDLLLSRPLSHSPSLMRNKVHLLSIPPVARSSPDGLMAQA